MVRMSIAYSPDVCELDHLGDLPQALLDSLPENQGHPVRHRCAACAYLAGLSEGAADIKRLVERVRELEEANARLSRDAG